MHDSSLKTFPNNRDKLVKTWEIKHTSLSPCRPKFSRCSPAKAFFPVALAEVLQLSAALAAVVPLRGQHRQFGVAAAAAVTAPQATATATAQAAYFSAKPVKTIAWDETSHKNFILANLEPTAQ